MEFLSDFRCPPAANRIKPFWFWNGAMEDVQIITQIHEMADKGIGGFFICARQGLQIPYLSKAWFSKVTLACNIAKKCGLECWLYDEYPYPSGMAGGEVLIQHPEAAHKILTMHSELQAGEVAINKQIGKGNVLCVKAVPVGNTGVLRWNDAIDLQDCIGVLQTQEICQPQEAEYIRLRYFSYGIQHVLQTTLPKGQWKLITITEEPLSDYKYYGNFFDPCCKEAVQTFIELTHEKYKQVLGHEFGKTIKGIFSDEVGFLGDYPWSHYMLSEFPKRKGYSLQEHLPALCENSYPNAATIRADYLAVLNEIFVESFHQQVAQWCEANGLMYATEVPSLRMTTQKYSTVVGGDTAHEKAGKPLDAIYDKYLCSYRYNSKNVASLAAQLDRHYAMIECFHSVGWTMTLQDAKWMIDRIGSDGINLFNFHAFCYTIDTLAKHDAPPSQFVQNPYWTHYKLLADYVARMSVFNTYTVAAQGIAVLDPVDSLDMLMANPIRNFSYAAENEEEKERLQKILLDWRWICKQILQNQYNYQMLDTEILQSA